MIPKPRDNNDYGHYRMESNVPKIHNELCTVQKNLPFCQPIVVWWIQQSYHAAIDVNIDGITQRFLPDIETPPPVTYPRFAIFSTRRIISSSHPPVAWSQSTVLLKFEWEPNCDVEGWRNNEPIHSICFDSFHSISCPKYYIREGLIQWESNVLTSTDRRSKST